MNSGKKRIEAHAADGAWVVSLPSHFLADAEKPLLEHVRAGLEQKPRLIVLDMSAVELLDTAGLGALVGALHLAQERGVPLVMVEPSGRPRTLLERAHIDRHAPLFPTLSAALGAPSP